MPGRGVSKKEKTEEDSGDGPGDTSGTDDAKREVVHGLRSSLGSVRPIK
jgi:hypothetical protein